MGGSFYRRIGGLRTKSAILYKQTKCEPGIIVSCRRLQIDEQEHENMEFKKLFERFGEAGRLALPGMEIPFADIPWSKHPAFEGVELKHIVASEQTNGQFSFHLVRIAPNKKIGRHIHESQLETHEVISGEGVCIHDQAEIRYEPGVITILPVAVPHEVLAGEEGLYLFAKFFPALI